MNLQQTLGQVIRRIYEHTDKHLTIKQYFFLSLSII